MSAMVHHVPMYSANGSTSSAVAVPGSSGGTSVVVTGSHPSGSVIQLSAVQSMPQMPAALPAEAGFQTALTAAPMVSYCTLPQGTMTQHHQQHYQHLIQPPQSQHHNPHHQQQQQQQHHIQLASFKQDSSSGNVTEFLGNVHSGPVPYQLVTGSNGQTYMIRGDQLHLLSQQPQLLAQLIDSAQTPQVLHQAPPPPPLQQAPLPLPQGQTHVITAAHTQAPVPLPPVQQQQQQQQQQSLLQAKLEACSQDSTVIGKPNTPQPPPMMISASIVPQPTQTPTITHAVVSTANNRTAATAASMGKSAAKSASAFVAASASIDNSGVNSESDDPLSSGPGGAPGSTNSNSKKKTVPTISTGRRCLKSEKVNSEESVRRAKRRERNRVAAAKCRKKRQDQIECLTDEASGLENDNSELEAEIAELLNRKSQLMCLLQAHQLECPEAAANLVIPALPPISLELSRQSQQQHQQTPTPPSLRSNSPGDLDNDPIDEGAALHPASSAAVGKSFNKPTQAAATPAAAADFDPNKSGIEPESFTVVLNNPSTSSQQQHPQQTTLLPPLHSIVSSLPSLSFASSAGQINCAQSQPQSADGDRQQQQLPPDLAPLFALKQETFLHL